MSVIGNRHTLTQLKKDSKPFENQRLVRVIAKKDGEGNYNANLTQSLCVSVPRVVDAQIAEAINQLMPHIGRMIEDAQDVIIRELRLETGCNEVDDEDISIAKVIAYLDAEGTGSRLTKEYLEKWFVESYSDVAAEFICTMNKWDAETLGEEQTKVVVQKTKLLASMFSGFSSGKYAPDIPKCKAMIKFAEFAEPVADERLQAFAVKAAENLKKREEEMSSDALGF